MTRERRREGMVVTRQMARERRRRVGMVVLVV
jgi:hypothetical protein